MYRVTQKTRGIQYISPSKSSLEEDQGVSEGDDEADSPGQLVIVERDGDTTAESDNDTAAVQVWTSLSFNEQL